MKDFQFQLEIVSHSERVYSGTAVQLTVRGTEGDMGIHYGHAPLLSEIIPSMLTIHPKHGEPQFLYVAGGIIEVQPTVVNIMADHIERAEEIDKAHAEAAKQHAEQQLQVCQKDEMLKLELELSQALAQLRVLKSARRFRHKS